MTEKQVVYKSVDLPMSRIDRIFEMYNHQAMVLSALYQAAFPDMHGIKCIGEYPTVSLETSDYIWNKFRSFDKVHHPEVIAGGAWLNRGFGYSHSCPSWQVRHIPADVEYYEDLSKWARFYDTEWAVHPNCIGGELG